MTTLIEKVTSWAEKLAGARSAVQELQDADMELRQAHAAVRHGLRGEIRLDTEKSHEKVDGIAALAMALSAPSCRASFPSRASRPFG